MTDVLAPCPTCRHMLEREQIGGRDVAFCEKCDAVIDPPPLAPEQRERRDLA
jgi:hypothetical protein